MTVTFAAMLAGFISIIKAAEGHYFVSAQLIMLSMILDGFDGNLARRLKVTSHFGAELDTFVDVTSFGVAPALLAYWAVLHEFGFWGLLLAAAMLSSGMIRLARFKVINPDRGNKGFTGLPITANAGWVAMVIYIFDSGYLGSLSSLTNGFLAIWAWGVSIVLISLQVSLVHYTKPTKNSFFLMFCASLVLSLFLNPHLGVISAVCICLLGMYYVFVMPIMPKLKQLQGIDDDDSVTVHPN